MRRYFNNSTRSIEVCGKIKNRSSFAMSNKVLSVLAEKSPNLTTFKVGNEHYCAKMCRIIINTSCRFAALSIM